MRRRLVIAVIVLAFLGVSVVVARWLNADTVERDDVIALLKAQARGDSADMLRRVDCADAGCRTQLETNARRLKAPGTVKIARFDSKTSHALTAQTDTTRVVWITPHRLTTVQCVLVRRTGNVLSGPSVSLLRLSAPIGREKPCGD